MPTFYTSMLELIIVDMARESEATVQRIFIYPYMNRASKEPAGTKLTRLGR